MSQNEECFSSSEDQLVRSLSMSRNMAFSVVDEVPHMIRLCQPETTETATAEKKPSWWKSSSSSASNSTSTKLRKSSSASSINNIRHQSLDNNTTGSSGTPSKEPTPRRGSDGLETIQNGLNSLTAQVSLSARVPATHTKSVQSVVTEPQHLTPIVKGTRRNDLLVGIVVSRWDNIVGPQSVYLWTEELTSVFYPVGLPQPINKLVKYVTDHTVDHQTATGGYIPPTVQRTTLCIVPDLGLAYQSLSIRVPTEIDTILEFQTSAPMTPGNPDNPALTMPHSISVLSNIKYLSQFLLLRPLIISWLLEFGPRLGVLLCKENLQGSMINSWCAELCKSITALQTCWVQEITDFGGDNNGRATGYNPLAANMESRNLPQHQQRMGPHGANGFSTDNVDTISSYLPPNRTIASKVSLGNILTSHLTSFSSSIVVGNDCLAVNQIIRFLLCFATSHEGYCSRYSLASLPDTFMKGLFVQGLVLGGIGERSISFKQAATNRNPLTRVELGSKVKVRQTQISTHTQEKEAIVMQELNKLWTSAIPPQQNAEAFPNQVKDVAGFVGQFLNELELLPPERRYGRLLLFKRMLHAKAMSLIAFLYSIQHKPPKDRQKLKQMIPQILGFDHAEYLIVQVTAEKVRPGVMSLLISH